MKCPECGSKEIVYRIDKRFMCQECRVLFSEPIEDFQISRREGLAHIG